MPWKARQNRDPHKCSHTSHQPMWGHNTDTTCSETTAEAENTSPRNGHTHTHTHHPGERQQVCWSHTPWTQTYSEPQQRTHWAHSVAQKQLAHRLQELLHTLKTQLMCKKTHTSGNTFLTGPETHRKPTFQVKLTEDAQTPEGGEQR